jgi:hypothetical protein
MKIIQEPIVFVDVVEIGETYTERLLTIKTKSCSMEEAKKDVRDAGYQVLDELCNVVPTTHEVRITIAVEPE